ASRCHVLPNSAGEYHRPPSRKLDTAATTTARKFTCDMRTLLAEKGAKGNRRHRRGAARARERRAGTGQRRLDVARSVAVAYQRQSGNGGGAVPAHRRCEATLVSRVLASHEVPCCSVGSLLIASACP